MLQIVFQCTDTIEELHFGFFDEGVIGLDGAEKCVAVIFDDINHLLQQRERGGRLCYGRYLHTLEDLGDHVCEALYIGHLAVMLFSRAMDNIQAKLGGQKICGTLVFVALHIDDCDIEPMNAVLAALRTKKGMQAYGIDALWHVFG